MINLNLKVKEIYVNNILINLYFLLNMMIIIIHHGL
jgi:hypothetical protein